MGLELDAKCKLAACCPKYHQNLGRTIQAALLDAFDEQGLRQLCRIELDENFDGIVAPGPLKQRVFDLITWADLKGHIPQLIAAACRQNPGNGKLEELRQQSQQWEVDNGVASSRSDAVAPAEERSWTRTVTRWVLTAIVVPVLLIIVGLYLEHNTPWFGGPTQMEPTGSQLVESSPTLTSSNVAPTIGTTKTNPIDGAVYVYVPAGAFLMGSNADDPKSMENEQPQKSVPVEAFWIMQTEVTNAQYIKCVEDGVCAHIPDRDDPQRAQYPVTNVSWEDAKTYAEWAGGRLPTETQWEKACRGTAGQRYPWGDEDPTGSRANYDNRQTPAHLARVGSYLAGVGPYGAADMTGNVWEWTYGSSQNLGSEPKTQYSYDSGNDEYWLKSEPAEDETHVLRGGGYDSGADYIRCAVRMEGVNGGRLSELGFRIVKLGF